MKTKDLMSAANNLFLHPRVCLNILDLEDKTLNGWSLVNAGSLDGELIRIKEMHDRDIEDQLIEAERAENQWRKCRSSSNNLHETEDKDTK